MKKLFFFLVMALFVSFSLTAFAVTIHVPADEPTIQAGINAAVFGDLVLVDPGIYVENIVFKGKRITVRSVEGAEATIIDGDSAGSVVSMNFGESRRSVLDGFTIRNGYAYNGGGIYCGFSSPTISNCWIVGNAAEMCGGGIFCIAALPKIENCVLWDNDGVGGGICGITSSPQISNSIVRYNMRGAMYFCLTSTPRITNCTIVNNYGPWMAGGIHATADDLVLVTNSILWGNSTPHEDSPEVWGLVVSFFCDIEGGAESFFPPWNPIVFWLFGNLDEDPRFIDAWDFHLDEGSPCIDKGIDLPRYRDACFPPSHCTDRNDMGAYGGPGACGWLGTN
ncbi:right-handed parallel beta-helix repeat-containing protein [Thermodesulfobacteriota bacterium]